MFNDFPISKAFSFNFDLLGRQSYKYFSSHANATRRSKWPDQDEGRRRNPPHEDKNATSPGVAFFLVSLLQTNFIAMKRALLIALAAVLTVGAASEAAAQKFELGARAGIGSQNMDFKPFGLINGKTQLGWHLAAVSRIRVVGFGDGLLGAGLFFQPEVVYSQNSLKGTKASASSSEGAPAESKVRMQRVDVPLLLSLKVSLARIQAGPVVNLMNNFETVDGNLEFLPVRSPVGYAVGASIDLGGLVIDGRYHGEFKKMSFQGDWADVKSRFSSWSLGVGLMF
jgi:hypothetical protein